jgi:cysteine sulfinate desulfinase/cysteine desulfurase-like protein
MGNINLEYVLLYRLSSGSACTAGSTTPSHVLAAMYEDEERAKHSVRFIFIRHIYSSLNL